VDNNNPLTPNKRLSRWPYIAVDVGDGLMTAAVAVFDHPMGLVWAEPHYIEGINTRPAAHAQMGTLRWGATVATLSGGNDTLILREPAGEDEEFIIRVTDAWRAIALEKYGRSRSEEREWLRQELAAMELSP
jgi:hypothetical protein